MTELESLDDTSDLAQALAHDRAATSELHDEDEEGDEERSADDGEEHDDVS